MLAGSDCLFALPDKCVRTLNKRDARADINKVMVARRIPERTGPIRREPTREKVLVYLPLRGTVMPLLQANAVLKDREPYVLMAQSIRRPG